MIVLAFRLFVALQEPAGIPRQRSDQDFSERLARIAKRITLFEGERLTVDLRVTRLP